MKGHPRTRPIRLAEKLLQIRLSLGLSQNGMLGRLGFSGELFRSNISQYELGTRQPPLGVLLEYAQAAGVCVDILINDKLDLPEKIPNTPKHAGLRVETATGGKRAR